MDLTCIGIVTCQGNSFSSNSKWSVSDSVWPDTCYPHDHWNSRNSSTSRTTWQDQPLAFLWDSGGQHQHFERRFVDTECVSAKLLITSSASARENMLTKGCCREFWMNESNGMFSWQWGKGALPQPAMSLRARKFSTKPKLVSSWHWWPGKAL